jgi:DNA modification methylase
MNYLFLPTLPGAGGLKQHVNLENDHPTVKNLDLMKYLIKLVTPKGGIVYDPFAGSGTTLVAAKQLNFDCVGVELSEKYCEIIKNRLNVISSPLEKFIVN